MTLYMSGGHHYELACKNTDKGTAAEAKITLGSIKATLGSYVSEDKELGLKIVATPHNYDFYVRDGLGEHYLGRAETKFLSSEVAGGFTGVYVGLYAIGNDKASFKNIIFQTL